VFAWLNLHTFGGVFIRPLGHLPDSKMDSYDLAVFRQIEDWGETFTGYPTVSGFAEFTYEPDKPLHGDLTDFGYHQRGCLSYVCELWDIFRELGIPRKKPFVDHYSQMTREDRVALAKWDATKNQGRIFRPWTKANHPQLGAVEVGGFDTRIGLSNPPLERLELLCRQHSDAFLRVAAMAPRLQVDPPRVQPLGPGVCRIELTVRNVGYLPTYGLPSAKDLPWNRPLTAQARTEGCTLVAPHEGKQELGHLEGWGRGRFDDDSSIFFPRSRGSVSETRVAFHVQGEGHLDITVGGPRVGQREVRVVLSSEHPGPDATASERG
jgi:hypothetical protein